jgi:anti-sigma28 factor (negative regulator of flagellin synthesis)
MINKIENNQLLSSASSMLQNTKKTFDNIGLDVSINTDYSSLVEMAKQSQQTDVDVIEKAREAIRSGELESMVNIQNAAENIFTFGI